MEPDQIVGALKRHAPLALAHVVLGAIIGLVIAAVSTPVYTSRTSALVAANGGDGTRSVSSASTVISAIMPTVVEIGTSQSVMDSVSAASGVDRSRLGGAVSLSNPTNSLIVEVTARASTPQDAQAIARSEVDALQNVVGGMSVKVQDQEVALSLSEIDGASLPSVPSGPSRTRYALVGGIIGAVLGATTALLLSRWSPVAAVSNRSGRRAGDSEGSDDSEDADDAGPADPAGGSRSPGGSDGAGSAEGAGMTVAWVRPGAVAKTADDPDRPSDTGARIGRAGTSGADGPGASSGYSGRRDYEHDDGYALADPQGSGTPRPVGTRATPLDFSPAGAGRSPSGPRA